MYGVVNDRVFWIYFIVTLFFIIIGIGSIMSTYNTHTVVLSVIWLLASIVLTIIIYYASLIWGPANPGVCVVDKDSGCFEPDKRIWLFANVLFIIMLIISVFWASELNNPDSGPLRTMSGILLLLGGLIFIKLVHMHSLAFWFTIVYLILWFILATYATLTD